ncbi:DegT/DnrJ/EryC1/StrS family aminotransferase [Thiomicrospira pelophila]|nr:DegT/DnrJ/EryC1/StrS family aminotransferase [Thiomicrospira pelophila]
MILWIPQIQNNQACLVSRDIASRVLCLPIYPDLNDEEQKQVINALKEGL